MNDNRVYNNIFDRIIKQISKNEELTKDDKNFIETLPNDKKMEIIILYDKIIVANKKIIDAFLNVKSLK
jgi:hypothetical protein